MNKFTIIKFLFSQNIKGADIDNFLYKIDRDYEINRIGTEFDCYITGQSEDEVQKQKEALIKQVKLFDPNVSITGKDMNVTEEKESDGDPFQDRWQGQ